MKYINSDNNKRYYTLDYFYKHKFKEKVAKVSLNGNFTCPNIDGTKAYGGCTFCRNGSSAFSSSKFKTIDEQFEEGINKIKRKWPVVKYIAYFQANTNTYDNVSALKKRFDNIIERKDVVGLALGTRSDALNDEIYDYLDELNKKTFVSIELGLQTINNKTIKNINRGDTKEEFEKAIKKLKKLNIHVVVHIINGFKGENNNDYIKIIKYLNKLNIDGIKIHSLFIEKGTKMAKEYLRKPWKVLTKEEYVNIVCNQIEELNENIVLERITGDPDKNYTIAPLWSHKKFSVINDIDKEMARRNTIQGFNNDIKYFIYQVLEKYLSKKDIVFVDTKKTEFLTFIRNYLYKGSILCDYKTLFETKNLSLIFLDKLSNQIDDLYKRLNPKGIIIVLDKLDKNLLNKYKFTIKKINNNYVTIIYPKNIFY